MSLVPTRLVCYDVPSIWLRAGRDPQFARLLLGTSKEIRDNE
jgi:hypothetical protein